MPYISIELSHPIPDTQCQRIASGTTNIMENILGKRADLTAVNISFNDAKSWFINDESLDNKLERSAFICAKISSDTNTDVEKKQAIEALYDLINEEAGPLTETSYVSLDETPMSDWGYGGQTQEARKIVRDSFGSINTEHYLKNAKKIRTATFHSLIKKLNPFRNRCTT